jgi:adenosylcobinamide-GDP ribazoletransferase
MRAFVHAAVGWLQTVLAAFQFLTRLPIPIQLPYTETICRRSVVFYPLVGIVIGLLLSFAGAGLRHVLPALPASVLLLGLWIALTGGLHLDGLMDTADGILSHRPREQMLEIMKDSRVGAMGVIVCVLQLLLKFALLSTLFAADSWKAASMLFVLVPVWSRWFIVIAIAGWPYARTESGLGSFFKNVHKGHVMLSMLLGLAVTYIIVRIGGAAYQLPSSWFFMQPWLYTLVFLVVTSIVGGGIAAYMSRKLGGLTGDTYGALNEILETVLLLVITVLLGLQGFWEE